MRKESKIVLKHMYRKHRKQMRFTFAIWEKKQKQNEKPISAGQKRWRLSWREKRKKKNIMFTAWENWRLSITAGYAVQKGEQVSSCTSEQNMYGRKETDLVYSTEAGKFQCEEGESSLDACERYMEQHRTAAWSDRLFSRSDGKVHQCGCPMIALWYWIGTCGTWRDIRWRYSCHVDPSTGIVYVGMSEWKYDRSRRIFIGYIRW